MIDINNTIVEGISNIPVNLLSPLVEDVSQLMDAVQYFGSALVLLYVIFMMLRYLEGRKTRQIMKEIQKDITKIKKDLKKK